MPITINKAKELNDKMVLQPHWGSAGICRVSTDALEECYEMLNHNYLPPTHPRVKHYEEHIDERGGNYLPFMVFEMTDKGLGCTFFDGRHTFCVMRDAGLKEIRVCTEHCRAKIAIENGFELIPEDEKAERFINEIKEQYNGKKQL